MRALIGLGATLVLLLIFLGIGMLRGITRSRIRAICILVCAVLAHLITLGIKKSFTYAKVAEALQNSASELAKNDVWKMIDSSESLQTALTQTAGALAAPLVYLLVFLVLQIVTLIIYWIVMIFVGRKLKKADADRPLRFLRVLGLAVAQALIVAFVFLTPIAFYSQIAATAVETAEDSGLMDAQTAQTVESMNLNSENESGFVKTYRVFGGNAVCKSLTKIKIDGEKTYVADEITIMAEFSGEILQLKNAGGISKFGDAEAETMEEMGETFVKSKLLTTIAGELIYQVTDKWSNGETFMGAEKPKVNEMLDPTLDVLIADFHQDARSSAAIKADFTTLSKVISVLVKGGVLESFEDQEALVNKLSSGDVIKSVIRYLGENPTLKNLIPEFTNLGMRAIGNMLSLPENAEEVYNEFIDDVKDAINVVLQENITNEEKVDILTTKLETALADSGVDVDLDRDSVSLYANALLAEFDGMESVSELDIQEFFEVYAAVHEDLAEEAASDPVSYLKPLASDSTTKFRSEKYAGKTLEQLKKETGAGMLANITAEIVQESKNASNDEAFKQTVKDIVAKHVDAYAEATGNVAIAETVKTGMQNADIRIDSISENDLKATVSIKAESFPTVIVTMDILLVDSNEAAKALNSETIEGEAEAISTLFNTAAVLKDKLPDGKSVDSLSEIAEDIGGILDTLKGTTSFGEEKTASLVTAVFQSDQVKDSLNLDLKAATDLAREATKPVDGQVDYTATMKSVSRGAEIAKKIGESDEPVSEDEIRELLNDMTPQTANMMCIYITPERVEGYGLAKEKSDSSAVLLKSLFTEMSKKESYPDYEEQTKAIAKMFDIAMAASKDTEDDAMFNHGAVEGRLKMTAAETVDTVMGSDMACNAVVNAVMDEDGKVKEGMFNPFGVKMSELNQSNDDYAECKAAIENYYNDHKNEEENLELRLTAIAALFGISELSFN